MMNLLKSLVTVCALSMLAINAHAHSALQHSMPAADATVPKVESLHLKFNGAVRLVKLTVQDASEHQVDIGFKPDSEAAEMFHLAMPMLAAGKYQVDWTIIGADGHTVSETFGFTVDPDAEPSAHAEHGSHEAHAH